MPGRRIDKEAARKKVLDALRAGNTLRAAAAYGGISEDTLRRWMDNAAFADSIKKAEADAEVRNVKLIQTAAIDGNWQAAAWWLERRRHEDWRRREEIRHGFSRLTDEELIATAKGMFGGDSQSPADTSRSGRES